MHYLEPVIHPLTIAIVGASRDSAKRGNRAIVSLVADKYQGKIYPINPKEEEILGFKCYPSIQDVPEPVDLAVVCTAAKTAPDVMEACGKAGVKGAVLLAGGFSEASDEGRVLEERTIATAKQYNVRIVGPNTNGTFSSRLGCNTIGTLGLPRGSISILSNSANIMSSLQNEMIVNGHSGVGVMLSVGNQADIRFDEYLEFLGTDTETKSIIFYVEGFKDASAFLKSASQVTLKKPIVMYIAGRNVAGKSAAKSHSGSLAGDYGVSKSLMKQAGILVTERSDELFPIAEALPLLPPMRGRRVAILSEGGGPITVASEACADRGLVLQPLSPETVARIQAIVPNASAISNPVDAGGGTDPRPEYYESISEAVLQDPNIDALLLVGLFGGYGHRWGPEAGVVEERVCRNLAQMMRTYDKPIMVQSHFAHMKTESLRLLREEGVPYPRHIETAVHCLAASAEYYSNRQRLAGAQAEATKPVPAATEIVQAAFKSQRHLLEPEAVSLLKLYGIETQPQLVIGHADDASRAIEAFGPMPVAIKVISKDVIHKSDVGGVRLNVSGAAAISDAVLSIEASVRQHVPHALIHGYLVSPMVPKGYGAARRADAGSNIWQGVDLWPRGIFVEVMRDVTFRSVPITKADATEMVEEIRHKDVLNGVRGSAPVDKERIIDLLLRVSAIAEAHPDIAEIDLNPVVAHRNGTSIVDARVILSLQKPNNDIGEESATAVTNA